MKRCGMGLALICLGMGMPAAAQGPKEDTVSGSVVKITATLRYPDVGRPWRKRDAQEGTGTGVMIDGRRILTAAHVVYNASQVFVQESRSSSKTEARIEAIAPGIDLAVLRLADESHLQSVRPVPKATELPRVKDTVLVYGFPQGGTDLSITRGIVSRIEYDSYYYDEMGLRIQVDAAINPGNSGGPALVDGRLIGIVFSRLTASDNIGYIIPNEEIDFFLKDVADGRYDGKPMLLDAVQNLENGALRTSLHLDPGVTGVMVSGVETPGSSYPLRAGDVITKVGDYAVDDVGLVKVRDDLRVGFRYLIPRVARDGKVPLGVVRDGKQTDLDVALPSRKERLFPFLDRGYPSYLVWGPLVFSRATDELIEAFGTKEVAPAWFPYLTYRNSPLLARRGDRPKFAGEELVIVLDMFPHPLSKGYTRPLYMVVESLDGTPVRNLRHLAELFRDAKGDRVTIRFADVGSEVIVLDRKGAIAAAEEILSENGIRRPYSDDLNPVFEPKK